MIPARLFQPGARLRVLCLGAHADDIEIGAGGTVLTWLASGARVDLSWCVASAAGDRATEARASATAFAEGAASFDLALGTFPDARLPYCEAELKSWLEDLRARAPRPDVVLTHRGDDAHQDHRTLSALAWTLHRDSLILEYEIPKWDGDLGRPNCYVPIEDETLARKLDLIERHFATQSGKDWFDPETFRGLARMRGVECRARYAEAFVARKMVLS